MKFTCSCSVLNALMSPDAHYLTGWVQYKVNGMTKAYAR